MVWLVPIAATIIDVIAKPDTATNDHEPEQCSVDFPEGLAAPDARLRHEWGRLLLAVIIKLVWAVLRARILWSVGRSGAQSESRPREQTAKDQRSPNVGICRLEEDH